jgi:hypothetical protein
VLPRCSISCLLKQDEMLVAAQTDSRFLGYSPDSKKVWCKIAEIICGEFEFWV